MKYLLLLALLCTPVYAHETVKPVPATGGNENHNNNSDNLKHAAEAIGLGLIGFAILYHPKGTNDVKEERKEIQFRLRADESR